MNVSRLRVLCFSVSLDGFGAGPDQGVEHPLGVNGQAIMEWIFPTRTWHETHLNGSSSPDDGETGVDDDLVRQGTEGIGAWILGRNMFGPGRGPWPGANWRGWWSDNPPFHASVFVLTHHPRKPLELEGGTTFHFVTDGIDSALRQARDAAGGRDIRLGGGVNTIRRYLKARLVDELHLAVRPVLLGRGEHLMHGLDLRAMGYDVTRQVAGERASHVFLEKVG